MGGMAPWQADHPEAARRPAAALRHHLRDGHIPSDSRTPRATSGSKFEEAWEAYLPGQNAVRGQFQPSEACKRASADGMGTSRDFRSVRETIPHGSKNANLSHSHAGLHACTDRKSENGDASDCDQRISRSTTTSLAPVSDPWEGLDIPDSLKRTRPRLGPPAISAGPDDDLGDLQ